MILNVSGRCDIVAFHTQWFINRYNEGFVDVRNPFYPKLVNRVYFDDVEAIVFCTKNPNPIIKYLNKIDKPILFHITLTPYHKDIEPNVIDKKNVIDGIKKISNIIGSDYIYVRYDPILVNDRYTIDYHIKAFNKICSVLDGYVKHIIISFVDDYKNVRKNMNILKIKKLNSDDYEKIGVNFSNIAKKHGMTVQTCAEDNNLIEYGFIKRDCVDLNLAFRLTGKTNLKKWKARGRTNCNCVEMVDIGAYNICNHMCKYCYANYDENKIQSNLKEHDSNSTMIIGKLEKNDILKPRKN